MSGTDSLAALRIPEVRRFALGRIVSVLGAQMLSVAIGWQLYDRTGSAWSLGLVGLVQIVPVVLLALPAGQAADKYPRKWMAMGALTLLALSAAGLAVVTWRNGPIWIIYCLLFATGIGTSFRSPSVSSMLPQLVPTELLTNANAWISSGFQLASMAGPALGGFIIAWTGGETLVYVLATAGHLFFVVLLLTLPTIRTEQQPGKRATGLKDALAGARFIFNARVLLAAMTLDLFAVLLGGATALLPIFAKDVLHVGASGLGWLRAAPSMGAFGMAVIQTRLKPWKSSGRALLVAVAGFGVATLVFGLSRNFTLSMVALVFTGVFDNVSVVIRLTLEQLLTPDPMRGRVSSIHYVFIGFSNELGEFESGSTAALFGPIASVVGGGIGTLLVVLIVAWVWPEIARLGALQDLKPLEVPREELSARPANEQGVVG
ncbi:MAG TPA: MFS transporter [Myxococcales bacterium]